VAVSCEPDPAWHPADDRALVKLDDGRSGHFPAPAAALHKPDTPHDDLGPVPDVAEIADLYGAILTRTVERDTIEIFGHYLFDVLLGRELWAEMQQKTEALGARHLELALTWPDDLSLHRLNWELMRSDDGFLAAGTPKLAVAITRLVETDAVKGAPQLKVPPRVLFVVGTSLADKEIRPGAELHGLLKQARATRAMRYRVLERASPKVLRQVVKGFEPDVVHFICHGGIDPDDGVYLDLQTDEQDADRKRYAHQLLFDLRMGDSFPTIVVLSACLTAGTPGAERVVLAAGHETAPMAATLVNGGIPIVLGMAGRVADITCRLFARRFAEAVIQGEPLVLATSEARQIAFADGRNALTSADWAFPAIFMAGAVPAGYAPVRQRESDELWRTIESWVTNYNLRSLYPVFCGREEFLRRFHDLFETPRAEDGKPQFDQEREPKRVLAAFVDTPEKGYGRTRLLQELASQAFRDGHLPVLLTFDTKDPPKDLGAFAREFDAAISTVRNDVLDLGEPLESQLALIEGPQDAPGLDQAIRAEMRRADGQLTARMVKLAIRADLSMLLADAGTRHPLFAALPSQVVVLLDDVDQYGPLVQDLMKQRDGILDAAGLGSSAQPVPVVMTCSLGLDATDKFLRPISEQRTRPSWLETASLGPFAENGEDLLAYELVLLHPFAPALWEGVSGVGWAFNDDVEDDVRARWEKRFRRAVKGIPQRFNSEGFYIVAESAHDQQFTIEADDETLLARLTRRE
jgi:hypothetical protein